MTERKTAQRPPGGARSGLWRRLRISHILTVVAGVVLLILADRLMEQPAFVDIIFENPTHYDISIDVTDGKHGRWMAVGTARRQSTAAFGETFDQGDRWIFRFSAQGEEGGELRLTKAELEASKWRLKIPETVSDELQAKGAPFPP